MANKIKIRRGLKADLPVLDVGEPALTTDTHEFLLGTSGGNKTIPLASGSPIVTTVTLSTTWSGSGPYTQVLSIAGATASTVLIADIILSTTTATAKTQAEQWAYVSKAVTGAGNITFTCLETKPTVALTVQLREV